MKTKIVYSIISICFVIIVSTPCFAFKVKSHKTINHDIAKNEMNGFSLSKYLNNNIGFTDGVLETVGDDKIFKLLGTGGIEEDTTPRYLNHFHNPLAASLDTAGFGIKVFGWGIYLGKSSILWSQKAQGKQSKAPFWTGDYSWYDVRTYYIEALASTNKSDREKKFAKTFRGLGQLMHLVHDSSVPEHARNDGHIDSHYEAWLKDHLDGVSSTPQENDFVLQALITTPSPFTEAPVPIANLFDSNQYTGNNPDITMSQDNGLAEYTNANFTTADTVLDIDQFPNPRIFDADGAVVSTIDEVVEQIDDPKNPRGTIPRTYFVKNGAGDSGYKIAAADALYKYISSNGIKKKKDILDDLVFKDYANKLVPKAVGYSASLLQYFFRGKLEMEPSSVGGEYIIENLGSEQLEGEFYLYYDDAVDELRKNVNTDKTPILITSSEVPLPSSADEDPLLPGEKSTAITIDSLPESEDYMLVFKGKMGHEDGAVIGKKVLNKWESWGANICDNNSWQAWADLGDGWDASSCPSLSDNINSGVAPLGTSWTLTDGILSQMIVGSSDLDLGYPAYSGLWIEGQSIDASKMKIKINTSVTGPDLFEFGSIIVLFLAGENGTGKDFILDRNFSTPALGGGPDVIYLNDNEGVAQTIDLTALGFGSNEKIIGMDLEVYCGHSVTCEYDLDYIDFIK